MDVERYKIILTKKINKELKDKIFNIFIYINTKVKNEVLGNDIRILGYYFVKNNKNKAKLIINNKKYNLKEFINNKIFINDKIKINIILSKDITNINHMFKNCAKLLEVSICDDFINFNDEEFYKSEESFSYNDEYNKDNYDENSYTNFYNDNDNIYSYCSEITKKVERDINHYNSTLTDIRNNIIIYQHNYYSNMSEIFYNCLSLSSIPDISKWNTYNITNISKTQYFFIVLEIFYILECIK